VRGADLSELRPTRLRRYPATNITPPITIEPIVSEVIVPGEKLDDGDYSAEREEDTANAHQPCGQA
jgi:hypothetical protein